MTPAMRRRLPTVAKRWILKHIQPCQEAGTEQVFDFYPTTACCEGPCERVKYTPPLPEVPEEFADLCGEGIGVRNEDATRRAIRIAERRQFYWNGAWGEMFRAGAAYAYEKAAKVFNDGCCVCIPGSPCKFHEDGTEWLSAIRALAGEGK